MSFPRSPGLRQGSRASVPGVLAFQPAHTLLPSTHTSFLPLSPCSLFSPHHLLSRSLWVLAQAKPSKFLIPFLLSSHLDDTPHTMDAWRARPHSGSGVPPAITKEGNSLAVQWLKLRALTAKSLASIPGRGTEIPQAAQCGQKNPKPKQTNKQTNKQRR